MFFLVLFLISPSFLSLPLESTRISSDLFPSRVLNVYLCFCISVIIPLLKPIVKIIDAFLFQEKRP
jgi:hypothetical protein